MRWPFVVMLLLLVGLAALNASQERTRSSAWAEAVTACEAHGGVPVVRATTVLGRSADVPACVRPVGD